MQKKIFDLAGISLSPSKRDLVQARLRGRVTANGFKSFKEYVQFLEGLNDKDQEWEVFINSLTTNKTDWFREPEHFDYLVSDFLPKWLKLKKKHLRIWCAASLTGEEPYTLSLVLNAALKDSGVTYEIIASDIDTKVLAVATNGVYQNNQLYQIPTQYHSGLAMGTGDISQWMKIKKPIKDKVSFQQFNLTKFPYAWDNRFDLVMCRNVLIYFASQTIEQVTQAMFEVSCPDACLIIAHSESLQNLKTSWKYIKPSIYGKGKIA